MGQFWTHLVGQFSTLIDKDETKVLESNNYQEHYALKHIPKADCRIYDNLLKLGGKS